MSVFLILFLLAVVLNILLLLPAIAILLLEFRLSNKLLKKERPEDWKKYLVLFLGYQAVVASLIIGIMSLLGGGSFIGSGPEMGLDKLYNVMILMLFVLVVVASLQLFVRRKYTYGEILFSSNEWAGVKIETDLFSKVKASNYAVRNPRKLKLSKGDRVRVKVDKKPFSASFPSEIEYSKK
jgi:uncharacterized membrane protein